MPETLQSVLEENVIYSHGSVAMLKADLISLIVEQESHLDPEGQHQIADRLLLDFIGDDEVTRLFDTIEKYYA